MFFLTGTAGEAPTPIYIYREKNLHITRPKAQREEEQNYKRLLSQRLFFSLSQGILMLTCVDFITVLPCSIITQ
jgi:hypothetical protein